jgi:hypothetical protein
MNCKHEQGAAIGIDAKNTLELTFPLGPPVCLLYPSVVCKPV